MDIVISPSSDKPIYTQIVEQISAQILKGDLLGGSLLPPIRTIARQLEISVITVKKAWEELERKGLIYAVVGKGSFVAPHKDAELDDKRESLAREQLAKDITFYQVLGLTQDEFVDLVSTMYPRDQQD